MSDQDRIYNINTCECESDLRSNEHYLSSSENKTWKKFRPVQDLTHDLCDTSAVLYLTELTSQLGAGHYVGSK